MKIGIKSFILSGYPHNKEINYFAKYVLPRIDNISLPDILKRKPKTKPMSPLGLGKRN